MSRAVVLLSGGLDSATALAIALDEGFECLPLTVDYGQRHAIELESARRVAGAFGLENKVVNVDLRAIGGSALTDSNIDVPKEGSPGIPPTYVPARNTILLSLALGYAEVAGASDIFIGANAIDYSGYPDCRPEFIAAFQDLAALATRAGSEGAPVVIRAPLIAMTKGQIIQRGMELGVDYSLTSSCYDPGTGGACGECDSCLIRAAAFAELGLEDPA